MFFFVTYETLKECCVPKKNVAFFLKKTGVLIKERMPLDNRQWISSVADPDPNNFLAGAGSGSESKRFGSATLFNVEK